MNPSQPLEFDRIFLSDGRLILQSTEIAVVSKAVEIQRTDQWNFLFAVGSGDSQQLLHIWQRMIHEPTFFDYQQRDPATAAADYPVATYGESYAAPAPAGLSYPSYQYGSGGGVQVALIGNSEFGHRRIVNLSNILKLNICVETLRRDRVLIQLCCHGDCPIDSVLRVNDGHCD